MPLAAALFPQMAAPAPQPLSDEDVFGTAPAMAPPLQAHTLAPVPIAPAAVPAPIPVPAPQPQAAAPKPVLSDADLFGGPAAPAPAGPSLWDRATTNAEHSFLHGTIQGAGANAADTANQGQIIRNLREQGQGEAADRYEAGIAADNAAREKRFADMPSWSAAPTITQKAEQGAAALTGDIIGSLFSPESLITKIPGLGGLLERGVPKVVEKVVPKAAAPAASRIVEAGANQAVVNTATDPLIQGANIASGSQAKYDPVQTALAPALGFLVGAGIHGASEAPAGLKGMADAFRAWRAGKAASAGEKVAAGAPDAAPTPQEVDDFAGSPEMAAFMKANGITKPDDPRIIQLQDRLANRRTKETESITVHPQDAGGSSTPAFHADQARQADERSAVQEGDMNPGMASTAGRQPRPQVPPVIPVDGQGRADVGDLGVRAGMDKFGADRVQLPVPTEPQPDRMTPEEVARSQAKMNGGNPNTAEPPSRFVAPEGRAPQTSDQVQSQRQASQAFDLANRQRERVGEIYDTQTAGRPEGVDASNVVLDDGFPVREVGERSHVDVNGKTVEMAKVHRYDPRTGQLDPEAVPYSVPVKQLKMGRYSAEPRRAQDFAARAEGPPPPETERMPNEGVRREPKQTYRATEPDPNEQFPGAGDGRSPLPKQPEGPHPGRQRPRGEDEAIRDFEVRQQQRASGEGPRYESRAEDTKTSSIAGGIGVDGRYAVDDRGFVKSDKGGPVKFSDQKQAAKWIINEGHKKSADQIFEIENHPSGKGFTVHERGRAENPGKEPPRSEGPSSQPKRAAGAPAAEGRGGSSLPGALPSPRAAAGLSEAARPHFDNALADVRDHREAAPAKKPKGDGSLFDAIREKGGIRDDRGDVAQIMQGHKNELFKKRVVSPNGLHPDKMREALQADGWFGSEDRHGANAHETGSYPGDDIKDLYDLMDREARGKKVYHPDRNSDAGNDHFAQEMRDEELHRAGVDPADSNEDAARKLAEYRASDEARFHAAEDQRKLDDAAQSGLSDEDLRGLYEEGYTAGHESDADARQEEPVGAESHRGKADDIPGWEEDAGANDHQAGPAERSTGKNADDGNTGERQSRVDGTEHEASAEELKARADRKRAEEKQQNPRAHNDRAQRPADEGLFADKSEKNQTDMFADPEKNDAANNLKDRFFSNPAGDPETWRELGRMLVDAFGWAKGEADAWKKHLEDMTDAIPRPEFQGDSRFKRAWNATYPMRKWVQTLAYSNDGRLRSMAAGFKSDAMREIADKFFAAPRGGREGAVGKDYFQAINQRRGQWLNQLDHVLEPFQKMTVKERDEAMKQIGRLVQNPGAIHPGTPVHNAAEAIGKMLKEAHQYLRAAGVEVGEVKRGYLPRVENTTEILANPDKFKAAAVRAYVADGVPVKDAKVAAENWLERVMLGDLGVNHNMPDFSTPVTGGNTTFTKGRELSKKADEIMGDFWLRNPADIIPAYIQRAVQKAEWSRRLGPRDKTTRPPRGVDAAEWHADPLGKWKDLKQRMIEEGNGEHISDVVKIIKSMTGNMALPAGRGRAAVNFARTWSALTYLPRAVFASLSEPVNISLRTGNTMDAGRAYFHTLQHWLPIVRNAAGPKYLRELAHDLGFIGEAIDNLTMLQRVGNEDGGRIGRMVQTKFFRRTGLTQLTEANRMAAVQIGQTFIRRLASDVVNKSHYQTISSRMLGELGIGAESAHDFAHFVMALDKPKAADILDGGKHGDLYNTALGRFVHQTVMAPTGATRSYFAQHPLGGLIYNLQSFNYAFQKNVLNRIGAMTKDALDPKSGLNAHERAFAMMPLLNTVPLLMVTYGIGEIRDALFQDPARKGRPDMTFADKSKRALSRAGITGSMDLPYNAITGARYQRDPLTTMLGPIVGGGDTLVGDALDAGSPRNSPTTNTFERKVGKDVYNMIVQPALEAGTLALAPEETALGFGLGTAGMYGFSHPAAREHVVKSLFGPPLPPR